MPAQTEVVETTRAEWSKDKGLWTLLVLLGMLSPFGWRLTALITLDLFPIHLIVSIYLGYRFGRWYAAIGGLVMTAPWFIWDPMLVPQSLEDLDILDARTLITRQYSWQEVLVAGLLGWVIGYLADRIESFMVGSGLPIAPQVPRRRRSWLERGGKRLTSFFQNWGRKPQRGESTEERPHTLDSLVTNLRSVGTRVNQLAIVPAVLIILNVSVAVHLVEFDRGYLVLHFFPAGLASVLIITIGLITASYVAVLIAFLVWIGSWVAAMGELQPFEFLSRADGVWFQIDGPTAAIGTAILAWLAVKFRRIVRAGEIPPAAKKMLDPCRSERVAPPAANLTAMLPILLLFFVFRFSYFVVSDPPQPDDARLSQSTELRESAGARAIGDDRELEIERIVVTGTVVGGLNDGEIRVYVEPWILIFTALVLLGSILDPRGVSNRFIALFALFMFIDFELYLAGWIRVSSYRPGVSEFLLLALAPFVGRYLDLRQLAVCRLLVAGGWLLTLLFSIYLHGTLDVASVRIQQWILPSLIIQVGLIETLSRLLHYLASLGTSVPAGSSTP